MAYFTSWDVNVFLCLVTIGIPEDVVKRAVVVAKKTHEPERANQGGMEPREGGATHSERWSCSALLIIVSVIAPIAKTNLSKTRQTAKLFSLPAKNKVVKQGNKLSH